MPFYKKTYQINNREEGKVAQRDQSYRNCLITLLIFFFMCLILIIACIPWKTRSYREYKNEYTEYEPQHHYEERTEEAIPISIMTDLSMNPRLPTSMTPETTTTSTTNAEIAESTKNVDVITEKYSKKNIKGFHHFERYSENSTTEDDVVTSSVTVSEKETENFSTMKKIVNYTETTEEDIDVVTLSNDIVTNTIDTASTLPNEPIVSDATLNYNVTIVDIIEDVASSKSDESTTDRYSSSMYYSTEESKADNTTDNISTLSSQLNEGLYENLYDELYQGFKEYATENSTNKYERLEAAIVSNITTPSFPTDSDSSTSTKYFSDPYNYFDKSQSNVAINNIIISTSSTQSDLEEAENIKYSTTDLNYKESTTNLEYSPALINENVTRENSSARDERSSATTKIGNEAEDMTNATLKNYSETTQKYNESVILSITEEYKALINNTNTTTISPFYNYTTQSTINLDDTMLIITGRTTSSDEDTNICETGHCKQIASKMLSYMNHTADPCEDFYEYACGGFEADPQLMDGNLIQKSKNYQRIARQMLKEKHENMHSNFATYYDSCIQYERNFNFNERVEMANNALNEIEELYINATWAVNYVDFTYLLAQLMSYHSALLFDVVPELDEYRPNSFTLKIGPTTYESPFKYMEEDPCFESDIETEGHYVDLEILYNNYKRCKSDTREFIKSIKEALIVFNVFKNLNDSYEERLKRIEETIHVIDTVLIQGYFSHFPSKSEIREAYILKDYSKISLDELQSNSTFVNWTQLIHSLTGMYIITSEANIQVYFHSALVKGLQILEKFSKEDPVGLKNAIIGLYAHKLYHELVLPRRNNVKDHCLHITTYLLQLEASSLYISSFTDHEIAQMNKMTEKMFNELKRTLKIKTEEAQWAREEGRQELLKKIDSLELALPVISYFKNRDLLYNEYNVPQIILYDNYFNNSMTLLKRYRTLIYTELKRKVGDPKQIWTYYATPFQSKAQAIYGLNLVVIPYGIIDWSLINDELSFDYLLLATLGNLIAHQIAHHFDANGIHYWNQTRNIQDSLMYENEFTDTNFDDYINCQKENLYQEPMNMTLSFTEQTVSFMIPRLTLNERLSEIMGLRLAYDTLALIRSNAERRTKLPWIKLHIDQLFYLAYAQTYCTKTPLTSSYISLHESEDLPNRIHVFVSASNNKLLAEAWNCRVGSQIAPNDVCSVFPYIDFKETAILSV
ncbi:neprilysin-2-like isoform X1 [Camponotus floridanus]|uniref:neprilysin-2-like isoform X1 n=1 Tax=Camponotus floridanus TaxID=104421 RepID=UPI00059CC14A|nr:neprilysin-2-like isoform X1 [Camponotus floridanus]